MRFKNLDLIICVVIAAINVAWLQVPNRLTFVGIFLALPLILFLPGYVLTQTLFRRRASGQTSDVASSAARQADLKVGHPVGRSDQLVLGLGLSMAIDVLIGFGLNILPVGLTALSWILSLGLITTIFALLAAFLRREESLKDAPKPRVRITIQDCLLLFLALLVVASALWLSVIRPLQPQPSFTQFWMLPADQADKTCEISLGVQSFETGSETYRIVIVVNDVQTNAWSSVVLSPQQRWVQNVAVKPGSTTVDSLAVEARLYRTEKPDTVYRDVHLIFYISSSNINGNVQQQCVLGTHS